MNNAFQLLAIGFLAIANACSGGGASEAVSDRQAMGTGASPNVEMAAADDGSRPIDADRKLIKSGTVEFETDDLDATRARIDGALSAHGAYLSADEQDRTGTRHYAYLTVRIPAARFDAFLADATRGVEAFDQKDIRVEDVTERFVDIEARLKTKKELESRYLELLDRASTVDDMLEIERELGSLRADIESIEGQLRYLGDQVALSTLQLRYYKRVPKSVSFAGEFGQGFHNGWRGFVWFLVYLVNIWPFIALLILGGLGIRMYARRRRRRSA